MEAIVRIKRELAYQGTVLKIYRDTVIANGIEEVFDYIHHNGAAAVLPVTADGKIMLVRQYRNAFLPTYIHHQTFDGPLTRKNSHSTEKPLLSFHKQTGKLNPVFPLFFWPGKSPFLIPSVFVPCLRICAMYWTRVGFKNKNFLDSD